MKYEAKIIMSIIFLETLNIEWGLIEPKGNRRVKENMQSRMGCFKQITQSYIFRQNKWLLMKTSKMFNPNDQFSYGTVSSAPLLPRLLHLLLATSQEETCLY